MIVDGHDWGRATCRIATNSELSSLDLTTEAATAAVCQTLDWKLRLKVDRNIAVIAGTRSIRRAVNQQSWDWDGT